MYVYHEYFNARRVALIYPSPDEETRIKKGEFLAVENQIEAIAAGTGNICSVITLETNSDIKKWQKHIYKTIVLKFILRQDLQTAHKLSYKNKDTIQSSTKCGCFYCLEIYDTNILTPADFVAESDGSFTVFCPKCGIDAVIGNQYPSLSITFLKEMNDYYFHY